MVDRIDPLSPTPDRDIPEGLTMASIQTNRGVHQFVRKDGSDLHGHHLGRLRQVGTD